ncbi:hypothetical protein [Brachybacterium hainanense]|uniref:Uncharacterized protein n=1 Tax=Brachybacterium hainanense TaxID=1541174 RepID=A0ABV6RC67_9MICO
MVAHTHEILTVPDLAEQWRRIAGDERAHTLIANRSEDQRIAADAREKADALTAQREELEAEMAAAVRVITVERIHPKTWGRIVAEHPARADDPYDRRMGFNTDTFDAALMTEAISSVVDGRGEPVEWDWRELADAMSPGKFEEIVSDTLRMHMDRDAVPFSLAVWRENQASEPSSK